MQKKNVIFIIDDFDLIDESSYGFLKYLVQEDYFEKNAKLVLGYKNEHSIAIYFQTNKLNNKIIKITFPCESILNQSLVFKQDKIDDMIQEGYDRTMYLLKSILSEGYDNLDYIYRTIGYMNKGTKNSSLRITGDVLVTNINKITRKLTRRKVL